MRLYAYGVGSVTVPENVVGDRNGLGPDTGQIRIDRQDQAKLGDIFRRPHADQLILYTSFFKPGHVSHPVDHGVGNDPEGIDFFFDTFPDQMKQSGHSEQNSHSMLLQGCHNIF